MSEMSNFFKKPNSKIVPPTSIFAQVEDRTVLPSPIDLWGAGVHGLQEKVSSGTNM
jgi:hypothetical protein